MLKNRSVLYLSIVLIALVVFLVQGQAASAIITLNPSITYQTMTGWEASIAATVLDYKKGLPAFGTMFDEAANDVGITRIQVRVHAGTEHPPGYGTQYLNGNISEGVLVSQYAYDVINDNADPNDSNLGGFEFTLLDWRMENMVLPYKQRLEARGEKLYTYLTYVDNGRSAVHHDPAEYAEFMQVLFDHLKTQYGFIPDGIDVMNEPDFNPAWDAKAMGRVIAQTGPRLAAAGYHPDFIAASTENRGRAVNWFTDVATVPNVSPYLKYLSYHWYADSAGDSRRNIADKSVQSGTNVMMNEAWRSVNNYLTFHDDLKVGRVSAWQQGAFNSTEGYYLIDSNNQVSLRPKTKFLRQYYKYIRPGAKRIDAVTTDSALDPVAFINADGRYVTVVRAATAGDFSVANLPPATYGIFYTTANEFDVQLPDVTLPAGQALQARIPAAGVITVYAKPPSSASFALAANGNASLTTTTPSQPLQTGYARIQGAQAGIALFGLRANGVLVSEAAVPAVRPMITGRIYAENGGPVRTGIAIANPNSQDVTVSFYFTDAQGQNFGTGSTLLQANQQIAAFLDEQPFAGYAQQFIGTATTFTFMASQPVTAIALRGFINERGESLMTTLPIADLSSAASTETVVIAHFAEGGGWTTQVILLNPTDNSALGNLQYFDTEGVLLETQSYSIAPRSSVNLLRSSTQPVIRTGSIHVVPDAGNPSPVGLCVPSFKFGGITVTETGVPAVRPMSGAYVYAETSAGLRSAFAFANAASQDVIVRFDVLGSNGIPIGVTGNVTLPANGQRSFFVDELPGGSAIPTPFRGMVQITAPAGSAVAAIGLRSRTNERGDFLISTTMPYDPAAPSPAELYIPHFVQGGGYSTQFILLGTSGPSVTNGLIEFRTQSGLPMSLAVQY